MDSKKIEADKIVSLSYTLREDNEYGPVLEVMDQHYPFKFYFGNGQLLPAFEVQLIGLSEGDGFEFTLSPEEAYGPIEQGNIVDVPKNVFSGNEDLIEHGQFVALTDDLGQSHNGKVLSFTEDSVKVDFNHIMAGKTLFFKGVVLLVREASLEEKIRKSYVEVGGVRR